MSIQDPAHAGHRAKVGMIGLAAVLLLIGLAAAVFATATKERPLVLAGTHTQAERRIADNAAAPSDKATNEPLAELGVAPSASPADPDAANGNATATPGAAHRR